MKNDSATALLLERGAEINATNAVLIQICISMDPQLILTSEVFPGGKNSFNDKYRGEKRFCDCIVAREKSRLECYRPRKCQNH